MPNYTIMWPEIFEGLTEQQMDTIMNTLGSHWIDGYRPTKDDVIACIKIMKDETSMPEAMVASISS